MLDQENKGSWLDPVIRFCLEQKLIVVLMIGLIVACGFLVAPFDWNLGTLPRSPVPVDAIPDIGENQQIVFTDWMGRSPRDVEDQITYPLTVSLMGIPGVKTIRGLSMFGFSTIYIIFEEKNEFYWSRSRILEKLNSLPEGLLPSGVKPTLGPDATALGQVFWYTLEGRDEQGRPTGGWDLHELRAIQDWTVRYALLSAKGVSEVASIGGYVQEYQIDVDPDAMRAHGVTLDDVFMAVTMSNLDVGARSIEINKVDYLIRGVGFVKSLSDLENAVIKSNEHVPLYVKNVATVVLGPALRQGVLDKEGAEVAGGVVVTRYGQNPLATIQNVKDRIREVSVSLPSKVLIDFNKTTPEQVTAFARQHGFEAYAGGQLNQQAWLDWIKPAKTSDRPDWLSLSQVQIIPFYDRSGVIYETLGTLNSALIEELLTSVLVVVVMLWHLKSAFMISTLLPLSVLMAFIGMRYLGIDANIVALSGIAIAIGDVADMGIIMVENILKRIQEAKEEDSRLEVIFEAAREVGPAIVTAVSTTLISFLPIFLMESSEGKLFKPLAFTKTFTLFASVICAITVIPPMAHVLLGSRLPVRWLGHAWHALLCVGGAIACAILPWWLGLPVIAAGVYHFAKPYAPRLILTWAPMLGSLMVFLVVTAYLNKHWMPLGPDKGFWINYMFVGLLNGGILAFLLFYEKLYPSVLRWCLDHKMTFLSLPCAILLLGAMIWLGFDKVFGWLPSTIRQFSPVTSIAHQFPGLGREFMPPLDEGSYLFMPTTMPHVSITEAVDILQLQNQAIRQIPEVESVVGKLGRAESALDPAPISMIETVINYKSEYLTDSNGKRRTFRFIESEADWFQDMDGAQVTAPDGLPYKVQGRFLRDTHGRLIEDPHGKPFRLWRPALDPELNPGRNSWRGIKVPDDIWDELLDAASVPGVTSAPKLQPIAARVVMLQSGVRAAMAIRIKGPDAETIERFGYEIEKYLKQAPLVEASAVVADRIIGKPYIEIDIRREAIARYGISVEAMQDTLEVALGGKLITTTVEGRRRFPVRVRYLRELRDSLEAIEKILVAAADGAQVPLAQVADIRYQPGPQELKSENAELIGYVLFDMIPGAAEVDVVESAQAHLKAREESGELKRPPLVSYEFTGNYTNHLRAQRKMMMILPLTMFIIFIIIYFEFRAAVTTLMVFSGILVSWAGGFLMLWLYSQDWFLNFAILGINMRELFQIHPINLSVAVWVGFLALFGVADDDGVVMTTYLRDTFSLKNPSAIRDIRNATVEAGGRRIKACLMTLATTLLALVPILTATGRGADVMVPMAIPSFGGMAIQLMTILVVPVLFCAIREFRQRSKWNDTLVSAFAILTLFIGPVLYCAVRDARDRRI